MRDGAIGKRPARYARSISSGVRTSRRRFTFGYVTNESCAAGAAIAAYFDGSAIGRAGPAATTVTEPMPMSRVISRATSSASAS